MAERLPFTSALVTGASSGIGEAMVHILGRAGIPMVVVARRVDRLEALAAQYPDVDVLAADLTTDDGVAEVAERVASDDAPIDLLVNNAGFGSSGEFSAIDADRLDREVRLNVGALTTLTRAALGAMVPRKRGYVLNVSSVASFQAMPRLAVYAATKAYVTSLSESLHEELLGTGVRVTALCPGLTRTEFMDISNWDEQERSLAPGFVWLSAEEVALAGLRDVAKNRALSIPGPLYKGLVAASTFTPRMVLRKVTGLMHR